MLQMGTSRNAGLRIAMVVGTLAAAGCSYQEGMPIVAGVMHRDADVELTRPHLLLRAIPDHPEGFAEGREYRGPLFFEDSCPTEHLEFPFEYMLTGDQRDVDETDGVRWRVLVWEADDPNATWVRPGEAYGTAAFHFVDDPYGSWATGVDLVIDHVAR
jgi:hypothetical protein